MKDIQVFQKEIDDGIGELVKAQASIAYCSPASRIETSDANFPMKIILEKICAENKNQFDLYYLTSVLVSIGWNKNDDVFLPERAWEARNTPEDKQFNFMHDEDDIIGHITGSYVVDKSGNIIPNDSPTHPDDFDILTQAVIYNSWSKEENKERIEKIIAEIGEGKWFVSMECLFAGFDYAVQDKHGNVQILQRDEASAFLTKHLRAYGGSGEYEGYKIGRALRQIAFSGKGLVNQPANPGSVIYPKTVASIKLDKDLNFSIGELNMPDTNTQIEQKLATVEAQLAAAIAENKTVKAQIEDAKNKEYAERISAFTTSISQKDEMIKTAETALAQSKADLTAAQAKLAELEASLAKLTEEAKAAKDECDKMKKEKTMMKRKALLVESGLSAEDAESSLAAYEGLTDESFEAIVANWSKKLKEKGAAAPTTPTTPTTPAANATTPAILEGVVTEPTVPATAGTTVTEAAEKARAGMVSWIETQVLSPKHSRSKKQ